MSYNFKPVMGSSSYKPWKQWEVADYLVGKYVSEGTDKFGNSTYKVEVIDSNFSENAPSAGSYFTFNSSGSIKRAFEDLEIGQVVKVIYKGLDTIKDGKFANKEFHNMEIFVAGSSKTEADDTDLV